MRRSTAGRIALIGAILVIGGVLAPTAATADDDGGVLAATSADLARGGYASHDTILSAEDVRRYWTPERMRAATPALPPAVTKADVVAQTGSTATPMRTEPALPSPQVLAEALRAVGEPVSGAAVGSVTAGKAFFIDPRDGKEHKCSGATVNSAKRRLVVTAGHCVHNVFWMLGWIFAPAYDNGAPYGTWIAGNLAARTDWIYYHLASADVGVAIMDNNLSGRRIVDVVGGNGLAWNQPLGQRVNLFAYPNDSSTQTACAGNTVTGVDVGTLGVGPCPFGPGGSGGAMLLHLGELGSGLGYVTSVAANTWGPRPNEVFGPIFENINAGLFYYAEAISP